MPKQPQNKERQAAAAMHACHPPAAGCSSAAADAAAAACDGSDWPSLLLSPSPPAPLPAAAPGGVRLASSRCLSPLSRLAGPVAGPGGAKDMRLLLRSAARARSQLPGACSRCTAADCPTPASCIVFTRAGRLRRAQLRASRPGQKASRGACLGEYRCWAVSQRLGLRCAGQAAHLSGTAHQSPPPNEFNAIAATAAIHRQADVSWTQQHRLQAHTTHSCAGDCSSSSSSSRAAMGGG